jgi:hypothetical protein
MIGLDWIWMKECKARCGDVDGHCGQDRDHCRYNYYQILSDNDIDDIDDNDDDMIYYRIMINKKKRRRKRNAKSRENVNDMECHVRMMIVYYCILLHIIAY